MNDFKRLMESKTHTYQYDVDGNLVEEKDKTISYLADSTFITLRFRVNSPYLKGGSSGNIFVRLKNVIKEFLEAEVEEEEQGDGEHDVDG